MATIKCIVPGCGFDVDASTACIDVTSLLGLRVLLETRVEQLGDDSNDLTEHKKQLVTINRYLKEYFPNPKILDEHVAVLKKRADVTLKPSTKRLYLQCTNPKPNPDGQHRAYYDVTCNEITNNGDQ